jgi:hypothetical protein
MKKISILVLLGFLGLFSTSTATAQSSNSGVQSAENLRMQLLDVMARETSLQNRAEELNQELIPENIERYFQGTGSTRPELLRDQRRRQLSQEKEGVLIQLEQVGVSRVRLEMAVRTAESIAYQESANVSSSSLIDGLWGAKYLANPRWQAAIFISIMVALGTVTLVAMMRRK